MCAHNLRAGPGDHEGSRSRFGNIADGIGTCIGRQGQGLCKYMHTPGNKFDEGDRAGSATFPHDVRRHIASPEEPFRRGKGRESPENYSSRWWRHR